MGGEGKKQDCAGEDGCRGERGRGEAECAVEGGRGGERQDCAVGDGKGVRQGRGRTVQGKDRRG